MISRRTFLTAPVAAAALAQSRKPNVLAIVADDLGFGDLGCYGATDVKTPHIDSMAASGMRFANFYANCPVCSPTRAALLSGCIPDRVGVPGVIRTQPENNWGRLSPSATLLSVPMKSAGYHTGVVGKWHLGLGSPDTPTERGFDFFQGFLGDMMDDYYTHLRHGNNYMRRNREEIKPEGHATDLFTSWTVDYLNERKRDGRPFFLYLAYNAPHTPIQPTPDSLDRVRKRQPGITEKRAKLVALIEHMDEGVGKVLDALRRNGQDRDTLAIFTSDNGGQLESGGTCGPYRGGKQDMYEGGIRVPMCAAWPGRIAAGSTSDAVAQSMDLYATACEAAGARAPEGIDGESLLPVLTGAARATRDRDRIWVRREGGPRYWGRDYYAIRRGDWKLLQNSPFEPYQLFNLREDPREQNDRAAREPKLVRELSLALARHVQRAGRIPWQASGA